jgi:hypothetical protein
MKRHLEKENKQLLLSGFVSSKFTFMVYAYNPSYFRGRERKIKSSRHTQAKLVRPFLRNKIQTQNKSKETWGMAQRLNTCLACMRTWVQ